MRVPVHGFPLSRNMLWVPGQKSAAHWFGTLLSILFQTCTSKSRTRKNHRYKATQRSTQHVSGLFAFVSRGTLRLARKSACAKRKAYRRSKTAHSAPTWRNLPLRTDNFFFKNKEETMNKIQRHDTLVSCAQPLWRHNRRKYRLRQTGNGKAANGGSCRIPRAFLLTEVVSVFSFTFFDHVRGVRRVFCDQLSVLRFSVWSLPPRRGASTWGGKVSTCFELVFLYLWVVDSCYRFLLFISDFILLRLARAVRLIAVQRSLDFTNFAQHRSATSLKP